MTDHAVMDVPNDAISRSNLEPDAPQPYTMHVSARYLDLTKRKLELTRLPREATTSGPAWRQGTPKAVLEPLLDYWLEQYDWRAQEAAFNNRLPQFRCNIDLSNSNIPNDSTTDSAKGQAQRIHFVHKRCQSTKAVPLLYCHGWPGSFLEASKIIDDLSNPTSAAIPPDTETPLGFHVIVPSIPGFGFSDAPVDARFGLEQTADCFNALMRRLGYSQYVAHGSGLGFAICRMLSLRHARNCIAVHAISPRFPRPSLRKSYAAAFRYHIASLTRARCDRLAFGYTPADLPASPPTQNTANPPQPADLIPTYAVQPHTRAFSLADSPAGLLASMLDILRPNTLTIPTKPASTSAAHSHRTAPDPPMEPIRESIESSLSLPHLTRPASPPWTPDDLLTWTMMIWLPGPESGLRWLTRAMHEAPVREGTMLWSAYSPVPLGISAFTTPQSGGGVPGPDGRDAGPGRDAGWSWVEAASWYLASRRRRSERWGVGGEQAAQRSPPGWAAAYQRVEWVRRHDAMVRLPVWEAADEVVVDMRECFGDMVARGLVSLPVGGDT